MQFYYQQFFSGLVVYYSSFNKYLQKGEKQNQVPILKDFSEDILFILLSFSIMIVLYCCWTSKPFSNRMNDDETISQLRRKSSGYTAVYILCLLMSGKCSFSCRKWNGSKAIGIPGYRPPGVLKCCRRFFSPQRRLLEEQPHFNSHYVFSKNVKYLSSGSYLICKRRDSFFSETAVEVVDSK